MTVPRLLLSVIADEIGPSLDEMISFAHEHGLKHLDMRSVGGRNLFEMPLKEVIEISRTLEKAGLDVPAFVSPVFKWPAPGRSMWGGVDFAFDPARCPSADWVDHAIEVAVILGAPHMRIFSFLRYPGFRPDHVGRTKEFQKLMLLAGRYDISLQVENDPVCNVGSISELAAFFTADEEAAKVTDDDEELDLTSQDDQPQERYLRPLINIANAWSTGERPGDADIALLAPHTTAIHLRDCDLSTNRTVPLGDGDVPWPAELRRLLGGVAAKEVLASIATHCPQDSRNAMARSIAGLRRIAAEIGVEVV